MGIIDNILLSLSNLMSNKMRSLLTMLGIIIGIGSVIGIVIVGNSLSGSITDSMSGFGINNLTVSLTDKSSSNSSNLFASIRMFSQNSYAESDLISTSMIDEYKELFEDVTYAIELSESAGSTTAKYDINTSTINLTGVNEDSLKYNDIEMITGRFIKDDDETRKICVIADEMATELFGSTSNAIGKQIQIEINSALVNYYIVGVYKYDDSTSSSMMSSTTTYTTYIPLETAKQINHANSGFSSINVRLNSNVDTNSYMSIIENFFTSYYTRNESYTVSVSSMGSMVETVTEMLSTVSLAIAAIAAISLLVGGIGVMNIMLVSITERTREIGTRIALGATQLVISFQFIVEAVVICLVGGLLGILLGITLGSVACNMLSYTMIISVEWIVYATLFSIAIGVFFGYYPARKASKMNPIDALRYE